MGYRGKTNEQHRARELRAEGWTVKEIAAELGVSQSSVSTWVRDVEVDPAVWAERVRSRRNHGWAKRRETFERKRTQRTIGDAEVARNLLGDLNDRDLFIAGIALYAGEGSKTPGSVTLPNSDPRMITLFLAFLRRFFVIDESRLHLRLYLHEGLDIDAANAFWSDITGIPIAQFNQPYRAVSDETIRRTKHPMGCPAVRYNCAATHRHVMSLVDALLSSVLPIRGSSIGRAGHC